MVTEQLIKLLAEQVGKDAGEITRETTFESLGIDSLDTVDLLMELEQELGAELDMDQRAATVGELADLIQAKLEA